MTTKPAPASLNVFTGKVQQKYGLETAIDKMPVDGTLHLSLNGLSGDECADMKNHGGPERALHQYPAEHYDYWQEKYGNQTAQVLDTTADTVPEWKAPGMGENLSTTGMLETNVCIGDQYQWGEAIIEVSQPRSPCFKLNRRWQLENFAVDMQDISRCGWLYRVLKTGMVSRDDTLTLIHRPDNAMTIRQVCDIFFGDPLNRSGLEALSAQAALSESWKGKIDKRLTHNSVENWNFRLLGRPA